MKCPKCRKNDAVEVEGDFHYCYSCQEKMYLSEMKTQIRDRMKAVGVPLRYLDAKLSDFDEEYPADKGLLLLGPVDTGKTHLLAALCRNKLLTGHKCMFIKAPMFFAELRENLDNSHKLIRLACTVEHLFIDDLGAEKTTEFVFDTWYRILDHRYSEMMYTSVTLNTVNTLDDRIFRRLRDSMNLVEMTQTIC